MLLELYIENFVLIDKLTIPFEKGLNILTGETGAGKSILLGALDLILGGKFNRDLVKNNEKKSVIQGTFELSKKAKKVLLEHGIEPEENLAIISRELTSAGRSVLRINGRMVSRSVILEVGEFLVDIHGQHEHQSLLKKATHIQLLDVFAERKIESDLNKVKILYNQIRELEQSLLSMILSPEEVQREIELLKYQLDEIEKAKLVKGEDSEIESRLEYLKNFEKIHHVMSGAHEVIHGDGGVYEQLSMVLRDVQSIEAYDDKIASVRKSIEDIYYGLEGVNDEIRGMADNVDFMPEELSELEDRLDTINDLKRKYGQKIEDIIDFSNQLKTRLAELENHTELVNELKCNLRQHEEQFDDLAETLSNKRRKAAVAFEKSIMREIHALNMKDAKFEVIFIKSAQRRQDGLDIVEFMISTNPGQPLRPLKKVVSGGELSRIMLSIKLILGNIDGIPTLIFDEVDTGISGKTASVVGEKLQEISTLHQVICVTHLPQIAVMADHHLFIEKQTQKSGSVSLVRPLPFEARIDEIGRLIGGDTITETTRVHALELLEIANRRKLSS